MTSTDVYQQAGLPDPHRGYLLTEHVAALLSAHGPGPVSQATVMDYVRQSRPGGRYETRPLRAPSGHFGPGGASVEPTRGRPFWAPGEGETLAQVEAELVAWRKGMPGRGAGGGRPRRVEGGR